MGRNKSTPQRKLASTNHETDNFMYIAPQDNAKEGGKEEKTQYSQVFQKDQDKTYENQEHNEETNAIGGMGLKENVDNIVEYPNDTCDYVEVEIQRSTSSDNSSDEVNTLIIYNDENDHLDMSDDENVSINESVPESSSIPIRRFHLPNTKLVMAKRNISSSAEHRLYNIDFTQKVEINSSQGICLLLCLCWNQKKSNGSCLSTKSSESKAPRKSKNSTHYDSDKATWFPPNYDEYLKSEQFHSVLSAINEGIISLSISNFPNHTQQNNMATISSSPTVTATLCLTPYAYITCTPSNLPRSPPLPNLMINAHNKPSNKSRSYHVAKLLQCAMGAIFPDTLMEDVFNSNKKKSARKNNSEKKNSITAKMIYNIVDNAHISRWVKKNGKEATNGVQKSDSKMIEDNTSMHESNSNSQCTNLKEIDGLLPTLRLYQEEAVKWMLHREKSRRMIIETISEAESGKVIQNKNDVNFEEDRSWELCWIVVLIGSRDNDVLVKPLYEYRKGKQTLGVKDTAFQKQNNETNQHDEDIKFAHLEKDPLCIYSPFTGWLCKSIEEARDASVWRSGETFPREVSGGILADSMGLGKTVEVLACMLSHRYPIPLIHKFELHPKVSTTNLSSDSENDQTDKPTKLNVQRDNLEDAACICGRDTLFLSSLSWVRCINCREPMHGRCAGFQSESQIVAETFGGMCDESRCPCCFSTKHSQLEKRIKSRATLIITPPSILNQWEREIRRHISGKTGLKIIVYEGVRELCSDSNAINIQNIHPYVLADADVVLMTFTSLMNELGHAGDNPFLSSFSGDGGPSGRSSQYRELRKRKRYRVVPSPLTSIHWWRICLDEAQRVETPTASSAKMALKLSSHHKWCITGTPIGHGKLEDLYGLLLFLGANPFRDRSLFRHSFNPDHRGVMERIEHLLRTVFWRSTKANKFIREQLGIPEQEEAKIFLEFSSIERHFYERQLEETILAANTVTQSTSKPRVSKKAKGEENILNAHLHRLRAACCHPQVGSNGIGRITSSEKKKSTSIAAGVLSMDQILDRLIDDAKNTCEESQRIGILHSNVLACINRLKVEARTRDDLGIQSIPETDRELLLKGKQIYVESLNIADQNAIPTNVVGEAILSGCKGFLHNRKVVRDGKVVLNWRVNSASERSVWARVDFEGPAKKITAVRIRPIMIPGKDEIIGNAGVLIPKDCILQVSSAAVGGEFIDVHQFTLKRGMCQNIEDVWETFGGFRTNKSKNWKILVTNYYEHSLGESHNDQRFFLGLEVQFMEPSIATDDLQRLHILNNTVIILSLLEQSSLSSNKNSGIPAFDANQCSEQRQRLEAEAANLESIYMAAARNLHHESQRHLGVATKTRRQHEEDLFSIKSEPFSVYLSQGKQNLEPWWNDVLAWCSIYGGSSQRDSICEVVRKDLFDLLEGTMESKLKSKDKFPEFESVDGLHAALNLRVEAKGALSYGNKSSCIDEVRKLSANPSSGEIIENSQCHICRKDWFQRGPECRHCKLEKRILDFETSLTDATVMCVLKALSKWLKDLKLSSQNASSERRSNIKEHDIILKSLLKKSVKFFELHNALKKEISCAKLAWRTHFDLLSDYDELNQCKRSMRLPYKNEDLTKLSEHELVSIIQPSDMTLLNMEHSAKQAMAFGELKRNKQTLRFLRNQNLQREEERIKKKFCKKEGSEHSTGNDSIEIDKATCVVCLSPFGTENRAVLACGHIFHYSPCLESLMSRSGNKNSISCPMRCSIRTKREDVMIASEIRRDDGSSNRIKRSVEGSWGTKVDRLVADILDVVDLGEKSIVFSQWDDMLLIVEKALSANHISHVRAKGAKKFGGSIKTFRGDCSVLLLNVKSGAEGLTLIEATHVFMIEPLLNCGLDIQAINRIHRIGQTAKTYVHRYIVRNTIEEKIDKLRMERQEHQMDEEEVDNKNNQVVRAGGIDGGFSQDELHEMLG